MSVLKIATPELPGADDALTDSCPAPRSSIVGPQTSADDRRAMRFSFFLGFFFLIFHSINIFHFSLISHITYLSSSQSHHSLFQNESLQEPKSDYGADNIYFSGLGSR